MLNKLIIASLATLIPVLAIADRDPGACPTQQCEDNRADRAQARAENAGRSSARQAHPAAPIRRVTAGCLQQSDSNAFACQVSVEFSGVSFTFECDWLVFDDGSVVGECFTFDDVAPNA
jgi:hypothetical protein